MKTETPREIAERLVDIWRKEHWLNDGATDENADLVNAVVAALDAERERAAKIAETHERTHGNMHFGYCGPAIATAIRSTDEN